MRTLRRQDGWKRASSTPRNRETELERETDTGLDTQDIFLRHKMAWLPMSFTLPKSSAHWKVAANSVTFPGMEK